MKADLTAQKEEYTAKVMHGYYERKIDNDTQIYKHLSNYWKKDKFVTSQQENYLSTIQDQELPRARDSGKTPDCNNKCRSCTTNVEYINHIIAGCSHMSARYYLLSDTTK